MDRFIDSINKFSPSNTVHLKSSMDRFIESTACRLHLHNFYLKSSMDRFIVLEDYDKPLVVAI